MTLKGARIAVFAENLYQELELWYPVLRFREAGAQVTIVGPDKGATYTSKHGYPVTTDASAADLKGADFDAIIVPGGYAPDYMRTKPHMVRLLREANAAGRIVAAICHAGWMLATADIVKGKRATCVPNIKDDLIHAGANYVDAEVVQDGNLITSRVPGDLPAFCRTILAALEERVGTKVAARV